MKEIKSIGFEIPADKINSIKLDSLSSLSECDIVMINPTFDSTSYSTYSSNSDSSYNGKPCYNHESSSKIYEHSLHWNKELITYLTSGKTLFINLSERKKFYIQTGRQTHSGTGRNKQTTHLVDIYDNYKFLPPLGGLEFNVAHGKTVISTDSFFSNFIKEFEDLINYQTYITHSKGVLEKELITKNKDKTLGGVLKVLGGHVVLLPYINFNKTDFFTKEDDSYWSSEGLKIGNRFCQYLVEIDEILVKASNKSPRPEWLDNKSFQIKSTLLIRNEILNKEKIIENVKEEIIQLNNELEESEKLNNLLFESGPVLEKAVTLALNILGYEAENFDNGILELDQIIVSPEGKRYIGECEGKDNKQIDITKFRQLSDALNEDFQRDEIMEKAFGLLIGNPFRFTIPNKRGEPFTTKCVSGAKREQIGLIETKELYRVCKYLMENSDDDFKKKCRETIHENLGDVIVFPELPK